MLKDIHKGSLQDRPVKIRQGGVGPAGPAVQADIGKIGGELPLEPLVPLFAEKTAGCVLMGDTGPKIASLLKAGGYPFPMLTAQSMDEAVAKAFSLAGGCGTVILSPAAASFDMFRNFEERGNCFKQAVLRL